MIWKLGSSFSIVFDLFIKCIHIETLLKCILSVQIYLFECTCETVIRNNKNAICDKIIIFELCKVLYSINNKLDCSFTINSDLNDLDY